MPKVKPHDANVIGGAVGGERVGGAVLAEEEVHARADLRATAAEDEAEVEPWPLSSVRTRPASAEFSAVGLYSST